MPKRKVDPLGRNFQIERRPTNRGSVDKVCNWVLDTQKDDFYGANGVEPSAKHVYYDAYLVIHGSAAAARMLSAAREEFGYEG